MSQDHLTLEDLDFLNHVNALFTRPGGLKDVIYEALNAAEPGTTFTMQVRIDRPGKLPAVLLLRGDKAKETTTGDGE